MYSLSAADFLDLRERGAGKAPVERALLLLSLAFPEVPREVLARLNIGQRDLCLLQLRSLTFGTQLKGLTDCQKCGERLELRFDTRDLPISASSPPDLATMQLSNLENSFRWEEYEVTFRLPTSMDLESLDQKMVGESGSQQLLELCILSTRYQDNPIRVSELPSETVNALIDHMSQMDALAGLTLAVSCPACSYTGTILFDIVSFFWSEIHAWSSRLIHEVHMLAKAYGWSETEILTMSAWRRQQYLELIGT